MLLQLRLQEKKENQPLFLQLLNEIHEEEQQQAVRQKSSAMKTTVRQVHTTDDELPTPGIDSLKSELAELRACVSALSAKQKKTSPSHPEVLASSQSHLTGTESDMHNLQKEVSELKAQLQEMTVNQQTTRPLEERERRNREEVWTSHTRPDSVQAHNDDSATILGKTIM